MPIFSSTPARITEPAVGASTWASGSQVCRGKTGTLMAKARMKAPNSHSWACRDRSRAMNSARPMPPAWKYSQRMPTSMNTEPTMVKMKNFTAA